MTINTVSASAITGTPVINHQGEDVGKIEEVMINMTNGEVAYLVLSYGGIFGTTLADKRFAVPFSAFGIADNDGDIRYTLNVSKQMLESAPGFDKDSYPDFADTEFQTLVRDYYSEAALHRAA